MKKKKPIKVLDAEQKKIGTTYSHRAQGLVMKGRARFIDENTIILDEGIPPCPPDINVNQEDIEMKELAIDTNEIVENGFGEIVETGKNVEAEEIAVENVEEAAEVVGDVTETEILDELNALLESLTDSDLIKLAYEVMNSSADYVMLSKGVNDSCINDISTAIEEVTTAHHNTLRKLMDAYSTLLERIKANKDNGVENTIETELFYKLKHVREKLTGNKAVDSAYTAILSATKSVHNIETGLNACNVLSEAFDTIIKNNGIYCESINKLLDIYISMLSK